MRQNSTKREGLNMCTEELRKLEGMLIVEGFYNTSIECQFESLYEELEEGLYIVAKETLREIKEEINSVFGAAL